jgi:hypothetical protein
MAGRLFLCVPAVFATLAAFALSATAVDAQVPLATGGVAVINSPQTGVHASVDDFGGFPSALTGTACISGLNGGCETSSGSVTPGLMVSTSGSTAGGVDTAVAGSQSQMTFYYEVLGPSYDAELDFSGVVTTSAGGADATADAGIGGSYGAPNLAACSSTTACPSGEKSSASASGVAYYVPTGVVAYVNLVVSGGSGEDAGGSGTYFALADPMITIDPTFLANNPEDYLVFSSNINPNGIPEPSTWAMMLIGFVGLGLAGRRTRKAASIAA